ncbi:ABC transporter permease [Mycobacterium sp. 852002-51152_SCH6134967]|uniref:SDR family oxidoreductase n=1 Tax=Mycobacterium sp. 852002-51152_SCH6134967 TaxID=1834096 RepID=UPI0007FC63E9|nr:SDR family oxidoreductase [Mycobacterium sp. 852002-51152_SCH6134967]OBF89435.1 ABC transporter permease [Mycobacterium sp. 852002-51152_SCH6134967]
MTSSTVVVGHTGELTRTLATELDAVTVAPGGELPADITRVVIVVDPCPRPVDVAALSGDDWHRLVDVSMWRTLTALQQARAGFSVGGRIVVVVPTIGMAGALGLVAYTTAVEGIRAMVKSAARQWSSQGVGANLVATPLSLFSDDAAAAGHLTVPAVADESTLMHTVAESVKFLLRPDLDHLAGETIVADGGSVMLP